VACEDRESFLSEPTEPSDAAERLRIFRQMETKKQAITVPRTKKATGLESGPIGTDERLVTAILAVKVNHEWKVPETIQTSPHETSPRHKREDAPQGTL
jgi:hypothetical protein